MLRATYVCCLVPACLPACLPAGLPACRPACLPTARWSGRFLFLVSGGGTTYTNETCTHRRIYTKNTNIIQHVLIAHPVSYTYNRSDTTTRIVMLIFIFRSPSHLLPFFSLSFLSIQLPGTRYYLITAVATQIRGHTAPP